MLYIYFLTLVIISVFATLIFVIKDFKKTKDDLIKRNKEIEKEKNQISTVIKYLSDGLLIFDKDQKLILINKRAQSILGIKDDKILNKNLLKILSYPEMKVLVPVLETGVNKRLKKEINFKNNVVLEVSIIPMLLKKKNIGILILLEDISQRKTIEKMKSEFVMIAAHQLRTPASIIKWNTKMLMDQDLGTVNKSQKDALRGIYTTNENIIKLVNELLDVSKIEEKSYLFKTELCSIKDVIKNALKVYDKKIISKNLNIVFKKTKNVPEIMMDKSKMEIALGSVLDNAIMYSYEKGKIEISLEKKDNKIIVKIKDYGIGIPKIHHDKVFTKFFRSVNALRKQTEGTGLGLFIVKSIIEAHGGEIWFDSNENKGATFYLSIPITKK